MTIWVKAALAVSAFCMAPAAEAATMVIGPIQAVAAGPDGTVGNSIFDWQLSPFARVTAVGYKFTLTALEPFWLSDIAIMLGSSDQNEVDFKPASGREEGGSVLYTGFADLADIGIDFSVVDDGILRFQLVSAFSAPAAVSPRLTDATFTITYDEMEQVAVIPEPAGWAMMIAGMAVVAGSLRTRRRIPALARG